MSRVLDSAHAVTQAGALASFAASPPPGGVFEPAVALPAFVSLLRLLEVASKELGPESINWVAESRKQCAAVGHLYACQLRHTMSVLGATIFLARAMDSIDVVEPR